MEDITIAFQDWSVDPEQASSPGQEVTVTIRCQAAFGAQYAVLGLRLVDTLYGDYYRHQSIVLNEVLGRSIYFSPGEVRTFHCRFTIPEHIAYSSRFAKTSLSLIGFANRRISDAKPAVTVKQQLTIKNRRQKWYLPPTQQYQIRPLPDFSRAIFLFIVAAFLSVGLFEAFNYGLLVVALVCWGSFFFEFDRLQKRPRFAPVCLEVRPEGTSALLTLLDFTQWPAIQGQVHLYYAAHEHIKNRTALQDDKADYLAKLTTKSARVEFPIPAGKVQKVLFNLRDPEPIQSIDREGFRVEPHLVMELVVDGITTLLYWPLNTITVGKPLPKLPIEFLTPQPLHPRPRPN